MRVYEFHKYIGFFLIYISFFVIFSGTLGYYRTNITLFMQSSLYSLKYDKNYLNSALNYVVKNYEFAPLLEIRPPTSLTPYTVVGSKNEINQKRYSNLEIIDNNGKRIETKSSFGGSFLGALHYDLYNLPKRITREYFGYFGIFLILILISGLFIRGIFKNMLKINAKNRVRKLHILFGVISILSLFLASFSGVFLSSRFILSPLIQKNMEINKSKEMTDRKDKKINNLEKQVDFDVNLNLENIKDIIQSSDKKISRIYIINSKKANPTLQINYFNDVKISGLGIKSDTKIYDINSKKLIKEIDKRKLAPYNFWFFFQKRLHIGDIFGSFFQFIFFICGILGLYICYSGSLIFAKRVKSQKAFELIKVCDLSVFTGLFFATSIYMLSSFVIGKEVEIRRFLEVYCFFGAFILAFIISLFKFRNVLNLVTSISIFLLFLVSIYYGGYKNHNVLIINLILIILSFMFLKLFRKDAF